MTVNLVLLAQCAVKRQKLLLVLQVTIVQR
jgi:hypothetical protein